ncbi:hypothetical protein L9W73_04865 [Vibrio aestuarianus]|uniref:Uncharacterized protein n=1 Tax=Vibrio aestuarianus TaxID=28171 RepID=A0A9X4IZQ7_9VIBR|nr:hypothetical protein [Vibrio aestuarianus]MDE1356642.1 hypothetical protein [Vibrio aestuarianus]
MIELFNQYEILKNKNETELVFIDSLLREPNYKEQIKRINKNKALPILNHRIGSEYYFILVKPNLKSTFKSNQQINMDVVNLIYAVEEFIEGDSKFANQCKNAITDKETRNLCISMLNQIKVEKEEEQREQDLDDWISELKNNGVDVIDLNEVIR